MASIFSAGNEPNFRRAAGARAARVFDTSRPFDLNMTIAQILRNGSVLVTGATLTGRCAAEVVPRRPGGWGWTEGKPQFATLRTCGVVPLRSTPPQPPFVT